MEVLFSHIGRVAQLDRVSPSEGGSRGFESRLAQKKHQAKTPGAFFERDE